MCVFKIPLIINYRKKQNKEGFTHGSNFGHTTAKHVPHENCACRSKQYSYSVEMKYMHFIAGQAQVSTDFKNQDYNTIFSLV